MLTDFKNFKLSRENKFCYECASSYLVSSQAVIVNRRFHVGLNADGSRSA